MKIQSPWVSFSKEMRLLFGNDPDIKVEYLEDDNEVRLYVENPIKADALTKLLPDEKIFGNVSMKITVVPANADEQSTASLIRTAFNGNPVVGEVKTMTTLTGNDVTFVMFEPEVAQYSNDNISHPYGITSTLYQEIAKELFDGKELGGVFFTTDILPRVIGCRED